jgi:hypothetical protein
MKALEKTKSILNAKSVILNRYIMLKKFILPILFLALYHLSIAQDTAVVLQTKSKQPKPFKERIYYGGNIGLSFGSITMIGIYPLMGYKFTPKLSAGIKIAYEYIEDKRFDLNYNTSNIGASIFARYRILRPVYLHVEYAGLNYELYNELGESNREWVPFLLVGAGYSQHLAGNAWLNFQILFDVLQNSRSPYNRWEPFYSVGVGLGF